MVPNKAKISNIVPVNDKVLATTWKHAGGSRFAFV
jgi:hypothetical protein